MTTATWKHKSLFSIAEGWAALFSNGGGGLLSRSKEFWELAHPSLGLI
jgi:hypothetical protein